MEFKTGAFNNRTSWLIRGFAILAAAAIWVLLAMIWPTSVHAPEEPDPALQASYDLAVALEMFGAEREDNYCTIFLGGVSVRPDLAVILQVRHAEAERHRSPHVSAMMGEFSSGRLYAWVDIERWTLFLTDHYRRLSRQEKYAVLYHEVRGIGSCG